MTPYQDCKIFGPYLRADGRQHVIIQDATGKCTTVSYPKYLKELELNRYLHITETVHHADRNINNNELSNLQILDKSEHSIKDALLDLNYN